MSEINPLSILAMYTAVRLGDEEQELLGDILRLKEADSEEELEELAEEFGENLGEYLEQVNREYDFFVDDGSDLNREGDEYA